MKTNRPQGIVFCIPVIASYRIGTVGTG